ncbi:MAG: hypothetical protein ACRYG4_08755 [Janthinobacterium lividum]
MGSMFPVPDTGSANRIFPLFDYLPERCVDITVVGAAAEPALRAGDIAIADTGDKYIAKGELYLVQYDHGRSVIAEAVLRVSRSNGATKQLWWLAPINRPATPEQFDERVSAGRRIHCADGPYEASGDGYAYLQSKIVGRIIGIRQATTAPAMRRVGPPVISRQTDGAAWLAAYRAEGGAVTPTEDASNKMWVWMPEPQSAALVALYRQLKDDAALVEGVRAAVSGLAPAVLAHAA